jgi:tetratricopeptide (TPR) repeat protein
MSLFLRKIMFLAVLVCLFGVGLASAQTTLIEGKVIGEDGKPMQGAIIKIDRLDIKGHYQTKTDKKGHYIYAGLQSGQYKVTLEVGGRDVDFKSGIRANLNEQPVVDFDLREIRKRQEEMQRAAESGQLTEEQQRQLSPEARAALEKQLKERAAAIAKNKELNDAYNAGMTAMQAKQYEAATQSFAKAAEIDPKQTAVWAQLGEAYSRLAETKIGAEQEPINAKAIEAYQKALELKPDDAQVRNNYALALVRAKKLEEAQAELNKAAQLDPANAGRYYYNLGAVLMNTGQTEAAGEFFKKAVEANPNYAPAQYQYGLYLIGKAQTTPDGKVVPVPGTREAFEKYLQLEPNGPNADSARAMLQSMETTIQTQYTNPEAAKKKASTSSKKK